MKVTKPGLYQLLKKHGTLPSRVILKIELINSKLVIDGFEEVIVEQEYLPVQQIKS